MRPVPARVLDVGAGSGVLAIVAVLAAPNRRRRSTSPSVSPAVVVDNALRNRRGRSDHRVDDAARRGRRHLRPRRREHPGAELDRARARPATGDGRRRHADRVGCARRIVTTTCSPRSRRWSSWASTSSTVGRRSSCAAVRRDVRTDRSSSSRIAFGGRLRRHGADDGRRQRTGGCRPPHGVVQLVTGGQAGGQRPAERVAGAGRVDDVDVERRAVDDAVGGVHVDAGAAAGDDHGAAPGRQQRRRRHRAARPRARWARRCRTPRAGRPAEEQPAPD